LALYLLIFFHHDEKNTSAPKPQHTFACNIYFPTQRNYGNG